MSYCNVLIVKYSEKGTVTESHEKDKGFDACCFVNCLSDCLNLSSGSLGKIQSSRKVLNLFIIFEDFCRCSVQLGPK